jgi:tetratricopeptide (TPR) repeat protein
MNTSNPTPARAQETFQRAVELHGQSRLADARRLYEQVLQWEAGHGGALVMLAALVLSTNELQRAIDLSDRAVRLDPHNIAAYMVRGHAQFQLHRHQAAVSSYEKAISISPGLADAHLHKGHALRGFKSFDAAAASYATAIALKPDLGPAHFHRGSVLRELGRLDAAIASFRRAIELDPACAEAPFECGLALSDLKQHEAALASYDRAVTIRTHYAEAHLSRGNTLKDLHRYREALASYDRAIAARPDYALAYSNRGNVLAELGETGPALASYDKAIELCPESAEAHCNRATLLHDLGGSDAALASFDRAIECRPDFAAAYQNRAYALLARGDFERGWSEHEWRWRNQQGSLVRAARSFPQPLWLGERSIAGKTILLHSEQGLGDTLQFCRYAQFVADLGATVILEVPGPLKTLLAGLDGISQIFVRGDALPAFDFHCPLMSMALAFRTTLSTVPARVPYIKPQAEQVLYWKEQLGERRKPRVGLVWSGGFRPDYPELWSVNNRRNVPLAKLSALKHSDIEFYTLQKGEPAESELAKLRSQNWGGPELVDFTELLRDFSDTAAFIENLDLVLSVDTSVAHLAGALGKRVWIMNRFDSCWRWMRERVDSPWYPTARLYRQSSAGDWAGVVERIRADLEQLIIPRTSRTG